MANEEPALPGAASLRQVIGALVFGSDHDVGLDELRRCLQAVATQEATPEAALFAQASTADIRDALTDLRKDIARLDLGIELVEVGGGFRFQTQAATGRWVRNLLKQDRPNRLSRPALETLSIVAYRQPIAKSEIEGIRGVTVDHILKALMEIHLVRIVGRSDLPGRPFLYGTTSTFLDHFGLRSLEELNEMDPTLQRARPRDRAALHRKAKSPKATEADADVSSDASEGAVALREVLGPAAPPPNAEPIFAPSER